jgi:hypothetical protein
MAFPTSNLSLSTVLTAYGKTKMSELGGLYYYDSTPPYTQRIIPNTNIALSIFFGKYWYNPADSRQDYTSRASVTIPPYVIRFTVELTGGGGGSGGCGGGFSDFAGQNQGGAGGGGGGGGFTSGIYVVTDSNRSLNIALTTPNGGAGGAGGSGSAGTRNGRPGSSGNPGSSAIFIFGSVSLTANPGSAGGGGDYAMVGNAGNGGVGGAGGIVSTAGPGGTATAGNAGGNSNQYNPAPGGLCGTGGTNGTGGTSPTGTQSDGPQGSPGDMGSIFITWHYI